MAFDIQYIKEHAKSEACIAVFTGLTEEGRSCDEKDPAM